MDKDVRLISYLTVRRAIGLLGMLLPFIMIIGASLANFCIQKSISHYYYTNMGSVFSGILCAVATFLFTYKGYDNDKKILSILDDNTVTNITAICAIIVAFFPCDKIYTPMNDNLNTTTLTVNTIHYLAASVLFNFLGIMSFFFFAITEKDVHLIQNPKQPTDKKLKRNKIYKTCAIIMWLAIVAIPICNFVLHLKFQYYTLIGEAVALFAFGVSWLIKGETFFKD